MTALGIEPDLVVVDELLDGDLPDDLWHFAANEEEDAKARAGLPWRTLCGQFRPRLKESKQTYTEEPDDCLVCHELWREGHGR